MYPKIASKLDNIAQQLESRGFILEALELDKISNSLEALPAPGTPVKSAPEAPLTSDNIPSLEELKQITKKPIKVIIGSYDQRMAMLVEAGIKDDFFNLMKKGLGGIKKTWSDIKDEATKAAIKGLDGAEAVNTYVKAHPELKWAVLAAIALGYLAMPGSAGAAVMDQSQVHHMAEKLNWYVGNGTMSVEVPAHWTDNLIWQSIQGHKGFTPQDMTDITKDIQTNLVKIITEKGKMLHLSGDTVKEIGKWTMDGLESSINKTLASIFK